MDKITLNDLYNMGDVLYGELEKIKSEIPEVPTVWDAVIRLTHADSSGPDNTSNITPSIVSGTYADLSVKITNGGFPRILVEYKHPWGMQFAIPMAYIRNCDSSSITVDIHGYSFVNEDYTMNLTLEWTTSDTINFQ